jgi:hypothetical protein
MYTIYCICILNVREYRRDNQKRTIQRNWQHRVHNKKKKNKIKHNTICVGHHYTQTNTNNVNKTSALLQTIEGKDEPNIILCGNRNWCISWHFTRNITGAYKTRINLSIRLIMKCTVDWFISHHCDIICDNQSDTLVKWFIRLMFYYHLYIPPSFS